MKNNRKADEILAGLFGSIFRARILELLVSQAGRVFYQREIMYETGLALRAVQRDMVRAFVEALRAGGPAPILFEDIYTVLKKLAKNLLDLTAAQIAVATREGSLVEVEHEA